MNKFEALKQFMAWPPEWQRLCAECWIESVQAKTSARLKQIKAAKVAAKPARNNMRYTRNELIEVDSHVSERRGPKEVARIMDRKYPRQRTIYAWEKMATRISKVGLQAMLERAIDVEFK